MLYIVGPVLLKVAPLNATDIGRKGSTDFAEHQVLGSAPVYEDTGEGRRTLSLKGVTFPKAQDFRGGPALLAALEQIRRSGSPVPVMRGDFTPMGWFLISDLQESGETLAADGVPGKLTFEIEMIQSDAPSVGGFISLAGAFLP